MKSIYYFLLPAFLYPSILSYSQRRTRIACVGNSITYGSTIGNREINSYPAQLGAMLGENNEVWNFGKSGDKAIITSPVYVWGFVLTLMGNQVSPIIVLTFSQVFPISSISERMKRSKSR